MKTLKRILSKLAVLVISLPLAITSAYATNGTLAPVGKQTFLTNNGDVCSGCKLFTYAAGTSTKLSTYSEVTLTTPNTNPIVLDSAGRATIYLDSVSYKFVLAPSTDTDPPVSPIWTQDNIGAVPVTDIETAFVGINLLADPTYLIWAAGDALAPTHWVLTGASAAVARTGSGLADTNRHTGKFAAKLTGGAGASATLAQRLISTTDYDDSFSLRTVSAGAWVKASNVSACRIYITDGAHTSSSSYHTGDGTWQWITVNSVIDASATQLQFGQEAAATRSCYFSGPTFIVGEIAPADYIPSPVVYTRYERTLSGAMTTGTSKMIIDTERPGIVKDVQLNVLTNPTGQALIVDVNTWDGAAFTSMYSTRPQIAASNARGAARPDTTYARRCVAGQYDSTALTGGLISVDIDQVGSGVAGSDLTVQIRVMEYLRPFEVFASYNAIN